MSHKCSSHDLLLTGRLVALPPIGCARPLVAQMQSNSCPYKWTQSRIMLIMWTLWNERHMACFFLLLFSARTAIYWLLVVRGSVRREQRSCVKKSFGFICYQKCQLRIHLISILSSHKQKNDALYAEKMVFSVNVFVRILVFFSFFLYSILLVSSLSPVWLDAPSPCHCRRMLPLAMPLCAMCACASITAWHMWAHRISS